MIVIVDYGMGNLRSVAKALERVGADARVSASPRAVDDAAGVVLPGVGAFRDCMRNLERLDLIPPLRRSLHAGKPFLGICLGLQVLFSQSEEFELTEGLNYFSGKVVRFPADLPDPDAKNGSAHLKVPHMGWNTISRRAASPVLDGLNDGTYVYFVHSYHVAPDDPGLAATVTHYGIEFVSSVAQDQLFACQFHPEKSQARGLQMLKNFSRLVEKGS